MTCYASPATLKRPGKGTTMVMEVVEERADLQMGVLSSLYHNGSTYL